LTLSGLEIVSESRDRDIEDGMTIYRIRYGLAAYELAAPELQIGEHAVRYYRSRAAVQDPAATPAGEIVMPPVRMALRSTLPAAGTQLPLRDQLSQSLLDGGFGWMFPLGLGLLAVSGLPVGIWLGALVKRRAAAARVRRAPRVDAGLNRSILADLQGIDHASESDRRLGYDLLEKALRGYLAGMPGLHAEALTSAELAGRVNQDGLGVPLEDVIKILHDCERARYGGPGHLPPAERFESGMAAARRLLTG
jgi:hypothetical protein